MRIRLVGSGLQWRAALAAAFLASTQAAADLAPGLFATTKVHVGLGLNVLYEVGLLSVMAPTDRKQERPRWIDNWVAYLQVGRE